MNKVIVIFGPTNTGKTAFSIELATYLHTQHSLMSEIVSADSRQLYRYMNIGTAKVSPEIRKQHKHHFIDILDPDERYSTDEYISDARAKIEQILERGHIPIIVGGTGTVVLGLVGANHLVGAKDSKLPYQTLMLVPEEERSEVYRRIEQSIEKMFHKGLYREVKGIIAHTGYTPWQLKVTTGYREFVEYAAKNHKDLARLDRRDLDKIKQQIKVHTKKYAMHQFGWLKKLDHYHVVGSIQHAKKEVDTFLVS